MILCFAQLSSGTRIKCAHALCDLLRVLLRNGPVIWLCCLTIPKQHTRNGLALDHILPNRVAGPSCLTVLHLDLVSLTQTVRWSPQGWNPDRICPMQHRGPRSASPTHGPQTLRSPRRPDLHRQGLHRRRRSHLRRPQLESRRRRGRDCSNPVIPQVTEFGPRPREGSSDRVLGSSGPRTRWTGL